jgi:hypothetical protein
MILIWILLASMIIGFYACIVFGCVQILALVYRLVAQYRTRKPYLRGERRYD